MMNANRRGGRPDRAGERPAARDIAGLEAASARHGEFGAFLREVSGAVGEVLRRRSPEQRLVEAIMRWEADGFRTARLEAGLMGGLSADQVDDVIASFENDVARSRALVDEIRALDATAPELARADVLLDPDRVDAAERLVKRVRDRIEHAQDGGARRDDAAAHNGAGADTAAAAAAPHADGSAGATRDGGDGGAVAGRATPLPEVGVVDRWFLSPEKVVWRWPYIEDAIVLPDER